MSKKNGSAKTSPTSQDNATVSTEQKHSGLIPFKPGQSGNPAGRPKGSRNKLGEAFIQAMHEDFSEHGAAVIAQVREEKPDQYLKVVASILPQQLNVRVSEFDDLSEEQLDQRIHALARALQLEAGTIAVAGREAAPQARKPLN